MTPGIYTMTAAEYHADPCPEPSLSSSMIHCLCTQSPAHAKARHPRLTLAPIEEEAEHFDTGAIAHALMLEGVSIAEVLPYKDWRKDAAKLARDAARAAGKIPILEKQWTAVQEMVASGREQLSQHKDAKDAFTEGLPEQTVIWNEDGIWCRARLDWLHSTYRKIFDYKTTGITANPEVVSRTLFNNGADIQDAWYRRGVKAVTGIDATFKFVYQETKLPHALSVIGLGPDVQVLAEKKILWALDTWRECLTTGDWPAYPNRTCYAELPGYLETRWLEKEMAEL